MYIGIWRYTAGALALSNSFGFEGTTCCVASAKAEGLGRKMTGKHDVER